MASRIASKKTPRLIRPLSYCHSSGEVARNWVKSSGGLRLRAAIFPAAMDQSKSTSTLPRSKMMAGEAGMSVHLPAALKRAAERQFVGEFQSAAGGQAETDAGDF